MELAQQTTGRNIGWPKEGMKTMLYECSSGTITVLCAVCAELVRLAELQSARKACQSVELVHFFVYSPIT